MSPPGRAWNEANLSEHPAIRQLVVARVRAGQSDQQIDAFLVSRYGPSILLRPPVRGGTAWVWVLPPVALALAVTSLGTVLWRRRQGVAVTVSTDDRALVQQALARRGAPGGRATEVVRAP